MGGVRQGVAWAADADPDGEGRGREEDELAVVVWETAFGALAAGAVVGGEEGVDARVTLACPLSLARLSRISLHLSSQSSPSSLLLLFFFVIWQFLFPWRRHQYPVLSRAFFSTVEHPLLLLSFFSRFLFC